MAGAVFMSDVPSQYGVVTPRIGVPNQVVASMVRGPSYGEPTVGAGPYRSAAAMLAWKGVDCPGWLRLGTIEKLATVAQYYAHYGMTADALMQQGMVGAADAYCGSPCASGMNMMIAAYGIHPAGQASGGTGAAAAPRVTDPYSLAGAVVGATADTIRAVVNSNNDLEKARLADQTQQQIARLAAQNGQTNDAQTQASNQAQIDALTQVLAQLRPSGGLSKGAWIAIGVVALALIGGGVYYYSRRPRHNPVRRHRGRYVVRRY